MVRSRKKSSNSSNFRKSENITSFGACLIFWSSFSRRLTSERLSFRRRKIYILQNAISKVVFLSSPPYAALALAANCQARTRGGCHFGRRVVLWRKRRGWFVLKMLFLPQLFDLRHEKQPLHRVLDRSVTRYILNRRFRYGAVRQFSFYFKFDCDLDCILSSLKMT